jgi:two-component system LytT family response regulator
MKIVLDASPNNRQALKELLSSRGIAVVKKSPVTFAPRGSILPDKGLVVAYDSLHPDELLDFIDSMGVLAGKAGDDIIIGKHKQGFVIIQAEDILYFMAWGNYVYCKILNERFEVNQKLYEVERNFKKSISSV